jgi:hypothetical protein
MSTSPLFVPMTFRRRSARKRILLPDGNPAVQTEPAGLDSTIVRALARAFRWRSLIENGEYSSIGDLARAEQIDHSYVSRLLRLTLLAPDIIVAILAGQDGVPTKLPDLLQPFPAEWDQQRQKFLKSCPRH